MTKDTPTPRTDALVEANRGKPCSQSVDCEFARELERDLSECRAALREIVVVDDLWQAAQSAGVSHNERANMIVEYYRRKPLAWSAARAILQSDEGEKS